MYEVSRNEINLIDERDKYKSYFYLSLMGAYVLVAILYFTLIDIHNLDKKYKKSQEDLATMTIKTMEQQVILSESEELLRILKDLDRSSN